MPGLCERFALTGVAALLLVARSLSARLPDQVVRCEITTLPAMATVSTEKLERRRPLNIRTVRSTGKFYFEFGKGPTLLIGPQRKTIEEAEADKHVVLGQYAECPRRLGRHLADFAAAHRRAEELCMKFCTEEIGIQERLGAFYISCTVQGSTKHAFRFTREEAIQARSLLLDGAEVPWKPEESPRFRFLLQSHKQGVHFPVFVLMCGPPALEAEFAELFGLSALQRELLSFPHVWADCQACSPAHLDARGALQRCPWEEGTTVESVTEHVKAALDAARAKKQKRAPPARVPAGEGARLAFPTRSRRHGVSVEIFRGSRCRCRSRAPLLSP